MSKRPLTHTIWTVPSKIKDGNGKPYPGGYPAGLLENLRKRMGEGVNTPSLRPWLHVCGGWADRYNNVKNWGYGPHDRKLDIDPGTEPDFLADCRSMFVATSVSGHFEINENNWLFLGPEGEAEQGKKFELALIDRDYDPEFARKHATPETWPDLQSLKKAARDCFELARVVAVLDKKPISLGKGYKQTWTLPVVISGGTQDMRVVTVWEKER